MSTRTNRADHRMILLCGGARQVYPALSVDGTTVEISVFPTTPYADSVGEQGSPSRCAPTRTA
jgi:hypothetical protein